MNPARNHSAPIGEVVAGLAASAEALCRDLLPGGRREGAEWVVDGAQSPLGCSIGVHLRAPRAGVWSAWAASQAGDALDLVAQINFAGDKSAALKWARSWLGLEGASYGPRPHTLAAARRPEPGLDDSAARSRQAKAIYLAAQVSLEDSPAAAYLRGRGLDLHRLGRQPRSLRFHPRLFDPITGRHWPALVAAIVPAGGGGQIALHRIFLGPDGQGGWGKAPIFDSKGHSQAKRSFGPKRGGIVPLWRGITGKPMREALPGESLFLSEGIEDGLAVALLTHGAARVAAAIDLGNMASLELPPAIATVVIAGQNDPWWHERPGHRDGGARHGASVGLDKAVRHFQAQGRQVRLWRPDAPGCKDANDYLQWLQRQPATEEQAA